MLVDAFTFYNELDMLEFRLKMLDPLVDRFVIVEADHTFSGKKKPFVFAEHQDRFDWARKKISYHRIRVPQAMVEAANSLPPSEYDPSHPCWSIEKFQRNSIGGACRSLPDNAYVMVGDVDEIPTREAVKIALDALGTKSAAVTFHMNMFYYNLKYLRGSIWPGTVMTDLAIVRAAGAQDIRDSRGVIPDAVTAAGWHLSYFNTPEGIANKIESFSHQEYNKDQFKDPDHVENCIRTGADLFEREVPVLKVDPESFPDYFKEIAPEGWW